MNYQRGDAVEWRVWTGGPGDTQRGTVAGVGPDGVEVSCGPWDDRMTVPPGTDGLRLVPAAMPADGGPK